LPGKLLLFGHFELRGRKINSQGDIISSQIQLSPYIVRPYSLSPDYFSRTGEFAVQKTADGKILLSLEAKYNGQEAVLVKAIDSNGNTLASEAKINQFVPTGLLYPGKSSIAAYTSSVFLITWSEYKPPGSYPDYGYHVWARLMNVSGAAITSLGAWYSLVHEYSVDGENSASTRLTNNALIIVWDDNNPPGSIRLRVIP
jgi:hypothetical protein